MELFYYVVFGAMAAVVAVLELGGKTNKDRITTSQAFNSFKNNYILVYSLMIGFFTSAGVEDALPISDISSDLTIEVGSASFALHKFPLISQSGRIRKLLLETKDTVNVKITISNVVLLRCTARFMEMIKDISKKNLEIRTEVFFKDVVFPNISNSISVLYRCETLQLVSKEVNLVSQLINTIVNNACKEQLTSGFSKLEYNFPPRPVQ
ncbi:BTB/POZ domain-containing protein SETH6 [Capsicum chinense]|nr:BTB/POZ domain-containing protein SETH6 [Capsicum chinense]